MVKQENIKSASPHATEEVGLTLILCRGLLKEYH
jgi:hypothetical protein